MHQSHLDLFVHFVESPLLVDFYALHSRLKLQRKGETGPRCLKKQKEVEMVADASLTKMLRK